MVSCARPLCPRASLPPSGDSIAWHAVEKLACSPWQTVWPTVHSTVLTFHTPVADCLEKETKRGGALKTILPVCSSCHDGGVLRKTFVLHSVLSDLHVLPSLGTRACLRSSWCGTYSCLRSCGTCPCQQPELMLRSCSCEGCIGGSRGADGINIQLGGTYITRCSISPSGT